MFEGGWRRGRAQDLLAPVLAAPAVGFAVVGAMPVQPQVTPVSSPELGRDLIQAGPLHNGFPIAGDHLGLPPQQLLHSPTVGNWRGLSPAYRITSDPNGVERKRFPQRNVPPQGPEVSGLRPKLFHLHAAVSGSSSGDLADPTRIRAHTAGGLVEDLVTRPEHCLRRQLARRRRSRYLSP